jgi:hypothetical protein
MDESPTAKKLRCVVIGAVLLVHVIAVPVAVAVTVHVYGFEDSLKRANLRTWTPIVSAQCYLLTLYFGFGGGSAMLRGVLFSIGMAYVLAVVVWAFSRLTTIPPPLLKNWLAIGRMNSLSYVLPAVLVAAALLPVRGVLGRIQLIPNCEPNQFRIADLLISTFLVAAALGWHQIVKDEPLNRGFILKVALNRAGLSIPCAAGCLLFVLSRTWWLAGAMILAAAIVWRLTQQDSPMTLVRAAIPWAIVVATLACYRVVGYELGRSVKPEPSQQVAAEVIA